MIDWAYQIFVNEIHEIHSHALYTNIREICTSEIWECKQKIFFRNAAWDWIIACRDRLDWNLKQRDKMWWETEQMRDLSTKA